VGKQYYALLAIVLGEQLGNTQTAPAPVTTDTSPAAAMVCLPQCTPPADGAARLGGGDMQGERMPARGVWELYSEGI
jgi:hypothetical protein